MTISEIADKFADYASWTIITGLLLVGFFYWTRHRPDARLLQSVGTVFTLATAVLIFWFVKSQS